MLKQNHVLLLILFLLIAPRCSVAQDNFFGNSGEKFTPSTIIIIIMAVVFTMTAFLALLLRQCSEGCFGLNIAPPNPNVTADGQLVVRGLDEEVIKALPTYFYADVKEHRKGKVELECPVCLTEFLDNEALRLLPGCSHVFHPRCIDRWLVTHVTCPICRHSLEPESSEPSKEHVIVNLPLTQDDQSRQSDGSDHPMHRRDDNYRHHDDEEEEEEDKEEGTRRSTSSNIVGKFPRSHSTGHSMADSERFTLTLPDDVHNTLVNRSSYGGSTLTSILSSPRRGYRWGWFSTTPTTPIVNTRSGSVRSLVSPAGGGSSKKLAALTPVKTSEKLWPI